jgi:hypothetical protein
VLSLLGAGTHVADDDLNARKAYNEYWFTRGQSPCAVR